VKDDRPLREGPAPRALTPLGALLERAREEVLHISAREAARRASMSEGRWRQIVTGRQLKGGGVIHVRPQPQRVVAMALAVDVDPATALAEAGIAISPESLTALITESRQPRRAAPATADEIATEIHRINSLDLDASAKWRLIQPLHDLLQQATIEQARVERHREAS
jgi:hypothetical protein